MASFFNNLGQRIDQGIAGLYNRDQVVDLENQYTNQYGVQDTSGGVASDARHMAAMNNLSNTIAGPINNISPSLGTFVGDAGAFGLGLIPEATAALTRGFNKENFGEIGEDIVANFKGTFGTPNSATAEDIYSQVFSGAVPQRVASSNNQAYGAAQASELTDLERDFPGMSTGDIIDSMNNRAFIGRQISPMAKPQIASPRTVIDPNRISGRIQEAVEPSTRFRDASNMAEYLQGNPQIMDNIQNTIGSGIDKFKSGLGSIKDFAMDKGRMGRNLLGSAGAMALGLPGIVGSGAMALMGGMGNMFEDRQLSGDGTTVDEYGRSYNASDLNKMNARGGYYTEAARSSRRRTNRINDMLARKAKGKRISAANLARLQAQEQAQEQARLTATRQMARDNRDNNTGGYQAGYSGSFMDGSGTAAEMGSSAMGGIIGHGGTGGRPAQSGLASMFTRRR